MGLLSALFGSKRADHKIVKSGTEDEIVTAADSLIRRKKHDRALSMLRSAVRRFPVSARLHERLDQVASSVAHIAIEATKRRMGRNPSAEQLTLICDLFHSAGDRTKATDFGRQAIQKDPNFAGGYHAVGRIYFDQFRVDQSSIDALNALRYLYKAQSLDPSNSTCLLQLAEIFLILHAPDAASKFLEPVERAFPSDNYVIQLRRRAKQLPGEETSQIQDLIQLHEQRLCGLIAAPQLRIELPEEVIGAINTLAAGDSRISGIYVVDGARNLCARADSVELSDQQVGEAFGMLADTVRQNCRRMGIGRFKRLFVTCKNGGLMVREADDDLTVLIAGNENMKKSDIETTVERLHDLVGSQKASSKR